MWNSPLDFYSNQWETNHFPQSAGLPKEREVIFLIINISPSLMDLKSWWTIEWFLIEFNFTFNNYTQWYDMVDSRSHTCLKWSWHTLHLQVFLLDSLSCLKMLYIWCAEISYQKYPGATFPWPTIFFFYMLYTLVPKTLSYNSQTADYSSFQLW